METFEVLKLIKAMQDLTQQPSYVVKNFDIDTGAFDVYYNDGALKNMIGTVLSTWILI